MNVLKFVLVFTSTLCLFGENTALDTATTKDVFSPAPLIQDCPDEKIINRMPSSTSSARSYYIYKGERREISEFDSVYVATFCKVQVTIAQ